MTAHTFSCSATRSWLAAILAAGSVAAKAQASAGTMDTASAQSPDKSGYTLFNPTPAARMRELSADRPDKTDCPFTIDAGHFQVEVDFANLTYNLPSSLRGDARSTAIEISPMNLKVGLLNNLDFQLVLTPFRWEETNYPSMVPVDRKSGFDGITPRFKLNLTGNDGGFFALALIPFVRIPLKGAHMDNGFIEGGLGIPYSFDIPGWDVGFQTTIHINHNALVGGYHTEVDNSLSIGHSLVGRLSVAVEFFSSVSTQQGSNWVGTGDTWLTYQAGEDLRLDGGMYIGVTGAADDWHPWVGMTWRI